MTPITSYIEEKLKLFCKTGCTSCGIHKVMRDSLKYRENELQALKLAVEALEDVIYSYESGTDFEPTLAKIQELLK